MSAWGFDDEMMGKVLGSAEDHQSGDFIADENFIVLKDAAPALGVFLRCQTQWRHSMAGITGLDYTVVLRIIEKLYKKPSKQLRILDEVRLIESGALSAISETRKS